MTPEGQAKLIEHEGEVLHAYQDSEGYWTIGIGHLIDKRKNGAIPQQVSRMLFEDDVGYWTAVARSNFPWFDGLDPVRQDIIVMLLFNVGLGGVRSFKKMIGAIIDKNWAEASFQLSDSKWARQVGENRKTDLCYSLERGYWPHPLRV